jgi:aspartate carbamoyltransferase catalytic subunit
MVKGETLINTAMTLNAMHLDVAVVLVSRLLVLN